MCLHILRDYLLRRLVWHFVLTRILYAWCTWLWPYSLLFSWEDTGQGFKVSPVYTGRRIISNSLCLEVFTWIFLSLCTGLLASHPAIKLHSPSPWPSVSRSAIQHTDEWTHITHDWPTSEKKTKKKHNLQPQIDCGFPLASHFNCHLFPTLNCQKQFYQILTGDSSQMYSHFSAH